MQGCQRCRWSCDEQHFRLVVNVSSTRLWRQWRSTRQQLMRSGAQDFCFSEGLFTRIRIDYSSSFFLTCNVLPPIFAGFPHRTLQGPLCFIVSFYLDWDSFDKYLFTHPNYPATNLFLTYLKQGQAKPFKMGWEFAAQIIGQVSPAKLNIDFKFDQNHLWLYLYVFSILFLWP